MIEWQSIYGSPQVTIHFGTDAWVAHTNFSKTKESPATLDDTVIDMGSGRKIRLESDSQNVHVLHIVNGIIIEEPLWLFMLCMLVHSHAFGIINAKYEPPI